MFKKIVVAAIVAFAATADETQAVQIRTNAKVDQKVEAEQKWGFLKNIVNIDRFFDSGVKAWASDRAHHPIVSNFIWLMQWTI